MLKGPLGKTKFLPRGLVIMHEDRDILIADKPPGMFTNSKIPNTVSAYQALTNYVKKGNPKAPHRLFMINKLDNLSSGILIFAKSEKAQKNLQLQWPKIAKKHLAVVYGEMEEKKKKIVSYLAENKAHKIYSTADKEQGVKAETTYQVKKASESLSLLEVVVFNDNKHQIRVQLADLNHPIVGEKIYGKHPREKTRLALHCYSITIKHPFTGKEMVIETEIPAYFQKLVKRTSND
jgi:tRNA pseudouridine32 synthase/23S rRNA pseudouridine746 synthase/23S rRNA pseudouridine1911/1915/1917 synthase